MRLLPISIAALLMAPNTQALTQTEANRLTACYANLLGITPPEIRLSNDMKDKHSGYTLSERLIVLRPSASAEMVAHEARHAYQFKHGKISRLELWLRSYENRSFEKDAYAWAANNAHHCTRSRQKKWRNKAPKKGSNWKPSKVKVLCKKGHKVKKGDTWYNLSSRHKKPNQWLNDRMFKPLQLGATVCI